MLLLNTHIDAISRLELCIDKLLQQYAIEETFRLCRKFHNDAYYEHTFVITNI